MAKPKTPLAPLDSSKTVKARAFRSGRMETWGAYTADGCWYIEREDSPGTPWVTIHIETGLAVNLSGTLRKARIAIANGYCDRRLEEVKVEEAEREAKRAERLASLTPPEQ